MTGRELILYILENGLEDEPVFKDGKFIGVRTITEVADQLFVGTATVRTWVELGMMDSVKVDGGIYIPITCKTITGRAFNA